MGMPVISDVIIRWVGRFHLERVQFQPFEIKHINLGITVLGQRDFVIVIIIIQLTIIFRQAVGLGVFAIRFD